MAGTHIRPSLFECAAIAVRNHGIDMGARINRGLLECLNGQEREYDNSSNKRSVSTNLASIHDENPRTAYCRRTNSKKQI